MVGVLGIIGYDAQDKSKLGLVQNIATLTIGILGITAIAKMNLWMIGIVKQEAFITVFFIIILLFKFSSQLQLES